MSCLDHLLGHERIKQLLGLYLDRIAPGQEGGGCLKIPRTFLFEGSCGVGKESFARAFALGLLAVDGLSQEQVQFDLVEHDPDSNPQIYNLENLRALVVDSARAPFQAHRRCFILHHADRITPAGLNTLLKMLEEGPTSSHFILLAADRTMLLPTICSRSLTLPFAPLSDRQVATYLERNWKLSPERAQLLSVQACGCLCRADTLAEGKEGLANYEAFLFDFVESCLTGDPIAQQRSGSKLECYLKEPTADRKRFFLAALHLVRDCHLLRLECRQTHQIAPLFFQSHRERLERLPSEQLPSLRRWIELIEALDRACVLNLPPKSLLLRLSSALQGVDAS